MPEYKKLYAWAHFAYHHHRASGKIRGYLGVATTLVVIGVKLPLHLLHRKKT
ncbi:MAG: hypothetical protein WCT37_00350 [Patescibacteria group bacterium]|jgi:hypothetical protein